ncbi:MAG: protein kinase, partial [Pirellulaceae bacterium]
MSVGQQFHPSQKELDAFAQGRLPPDDMAEVERHVATCDSCCQQLQAAPEDTLVQLAREAATLSFHDDRPKSAKPVPPDVPAELTDHPRYRVLGLIGAGGMGAVYKAQHRLMERLVALKVISPEFLQNEAAVDRFRREFRAVARLSHPNIVTAYDAEQAGALHFLVMEFVEGLSLDQLVAQRGPLPIRQACELIRQAALGLAHIHERGMVHRDIKPQNVMVGRLGNTLKILDCGLARLSSDRHSGRPDAEGEATWAGATPVGMVLGTPDYMAPEQSVCAASADIRSDIYSLGCTLYFALAGQPPFPQGTAVEKLLAHAQRQPLRIESLRPDAPPQLARILERMLAKDPASRYQTPLELAGELAKIADWEISAAATPAAQATVPISPALLAELPTMVAPVRSLPDAAIRPIRLDRRSLLMGGLVLGVSAAVPTGIWLFSGGSDRPGGTATPPLPRKVLLVIPRSGLWLADYEDVKNALVNEHQIEVVTASSELKPSQLAPQSRAGVARPDIVLDLSIRAADYGAIVFVGLGTEEYHPGTPLGDVVGQLLQDFQSQRRLITAICGGQKALA